MLSPFIDVTKAVELIDGTDDIAVCDCRAYLDERNGIDSYRAGHIPGARFVDLETLVSGTPETGTGGGRHPMPSGGAFAAGLGELGIGHNTTVIAYDDVGGAIAARFVWMLRVLGQSAAIIDGGIQAWRGELETGDLRFEPVVHAARPFPADAMAIADDVAETIDAGGLVVDSRGAARYVGETEPIDPIAGHIPGAINLPFAENLHEGALRPADELADRFIDAGVTADTIFYCGSGVTACHNILSAEAAGIPRPKLYVGSWSGWIDRADPAVANG